MEFAQGTYKLRNPGCLNAWTLFFWAWWIAWGPFVGLFLARISRGRTIAEFVAGTLILPLTFMIVWMSVMGNSAIDMVMNGAQEFGQQAMDNPGSAIYMFLEQIPWAGLTTIVVSILAFIFFITSGDSGSLVLSNLTSILKDPYSDAPSWMRIMWATIIGLLTIALMMADGLTALQSAVVVTGLPFAIVLCVMMVGLVKALRLEGLKQRSIDANLPTYTHSGEEGKSWTERLQRAMSFPNEKQCQDFLDNVAKPAMEEVKKELEARDLKVDLIDRNHEEEVYLALKADLQSAQDFYYELRPSKHLMPSFATGSVKGSERYYRVEVMLVEGGQGYDMMGYTKSQVIADILEHFERHMHFLHAQREMPGANVELFKPQKE